MHVQEKNIAIGSAQDYIVDEGKIVLKLSNNQDDDIQYNYTIDKNHIQFHFCTKGKSKFILNQGRYSFTV